MKRYANFDIFNDITRPGSTLSPKELVPTRTHEDRFQTDIIINGKTNFEKDNTIIKSLNDEIVTLKNKMRFVTEKDENIHKLRLEVTSLKKDIAELNRTSGQYNHAKIENQKLRDELDNLRIKMTRLDSLETENQNIRKKLVEYHEKIQEKETIEEFSIEDITESALEQPEKSEQSEQSEQPKEHLISIDVVQLKQVLFNRLQTYHEKHIDELITTYDLHSKHEISKKTLEELLQEAIHI